MDQETAALIVITVATLCVFFVLPFVALVKFSKRHMEAYEEAAAHRRKHPSKQTNNLKADYTWRKWKIAYLIAALLILVGVFIGVSVYNGQRVCVSWSTGDINDTTIFDRYRSGTTCKTLAERSEGVNIAGLTGLATVILAAGWLALPSVYRYTRPDR